jgi:MscS family membrane protein
MRALLSVFLAAWGIFFAGLVAQGADAPPPTSLAPTQTADRELANKAAGASTQVKKEEAPNFFEELVDGILEAFDVPTSGNTVTHYAISACFLVLALILRWVVTRVFFGVFRRIAARTETTLDDKLFLALQAP